MSESWIEIPAHQLPDEENVCAIELQGKSLCLYRLNGEYFASDNQCTHGDADLSDGLILENGSIECPLHEGTFDIRTGQALSAPCTSNLRVYPVRVQQGVIAIKLES